MLKKKSFLKNFNKSLLSVNERIESFFNRLANLINAKSKKKNNLLSINKKILISIAIIVISFLSYFSIPSFYDKNLVKIKLTKEILDKYNLEVKFNGPLRYSLFPKPHYFINDLNIIYEDENLAKSDSTKIFISKKNFFSFEKVHIKDLKFNKTEFNINLNNFEFFKKILDSRINNHNNIDFIDSSLFFKDQNEDVIFIVNIKNLEFLYNDKFEQELIANLNIFNIPFKIKITKNDDKKNSFIDIESNKLRLNVQNRLDYSKEKKRGLLNLKVIKDLDKIDYILNKNSLIFSTQEKKFKGKLDFKPFYLSSDFQFYQLDIGKLLKDDSILLDILNSDILSNPNLNAAVNIYFDRIKNTNYFRDIILKTYFEEGNINIKETSLNWKDSVNINFDDVQVISENNKISFTGAVSLDFNNIDEFYKQYQIKKIHRKKLKNISLDFFFNLYENEIQFDNLKIDSVSNESFDKFLNDFNLKKINIFNKVVFRNEVKNFFTNL